MPDKKKLIDTLELQKTLTKEEFIELLTGFTDEDAEYIRQKAVKNALQYFDNKIYTRGLIEFTNYCKNDCYYCGIRKSNTKVTRYRLTKEDILQCCKQGYELGFRTFVLQGGEDLRYSDDELADIISTIKAGYPDCAITLSIGEKSYESYLAYFKAGADRYLLRHETANQEHYGKLHPDSLSLENRKQCLRNLKDIGYQVGTGFMVGSPYQTAEYLAEDLLFIKELSPAMIGIGPYLPHHDTPFADMEKGSMELTLYLISILRLMVPNALIPATTALGTIHPLGREKGVLSGANVVMPNLSPVTVRKKYELYDNKICTGDEAAECKVCLQNRMKKVGYEIISARGDFVPIEG
ncbi:[FeFe] hydrogenase H-cluster radical SAM maturase HydE [Anaerocolumna sedimenticola]|uniref:[FeFe] hydrogenase H-cluster radical SAM maturase HydE n=1 Tax=Anaerocolumna sedimenticola TaxID=2696063 RepID=A0A6P1TKZ9_9FIRM|nr:[FeFe] hydrogenase H-cluster radical SAM maturase HydE [Anaerocolumna sedimenticola]QHQ60967.1 [FeFe] hydrogenase H-cluster radical SAM maturase HydE [Anaerocolumna sedimenticola]